MNCIVALLILSLVFIASPLVYYVGKFLKNYFFTPDVNSKSGVSKMLPISLSLICSIWCLRYAVGYYDIITATEGTYTLNRFEEIFNSIAHALQTFSMDEDYTGYILSGKAMLRDLFGVDTKWQTVYGVYASLLNFVAPIVGGAIIFEILASIFPKLKLRSSYVAYWKEKYFFSELNDESLALAKSISLAKYPIFRKPVIIFTDTYTDDENEKSSELLLEAKKLGAICIPDDLANIVKNKRGERRFFLIDREEIGNLQLLAKLSDKQNCRYLKGSEVYMFTDSDAYHQVEKQFFDKLKNVHGFSEDELPIFIPVNSYKNLITNLLSDLPLYEPIVKKERSKENPADLTVTILGTGSIGREMFLSAYWYGQMLDTRLHINVVSQESEKVFRSRIDYANPEILRTADKDDEILKVNSRGDMADPYCTVRYYQCDVKSSDFISLIKNADGTLADSDYFLVALGSDEDNIAVADTVRRYVGERHISTHNAKRTVVAYVVYDSELARTLNGTKRYSFVSEACDVYTCAIGSLDEVYSINNVFMQASVSLSQKAEEFYQSIQNKEKRASWHKGRSRDDYKYWANLARGKHLKYKIFSLGVYTDSIFELDGDEYRRSRDEAFEKYKNIVLGNCEFPDEKAVKAHITLLHRMAWLEHRRWNAFTRVYGFRHSSDYDTYAKQSGSYKQMDIKLHPCLVECDQLGIRGAIDEHCAIDEETLFKADESELDLLDELSYDLKKRGLNGYDFKLYDYPNGDC